MSSLFDSLSEELFQILKGSGKTLTLYGSDGNKTYDPKKARRVFAVPGNLMVSVTEAGSDSEVKLYLSQSTDVQEIAPLIQTLRQVTTRYNVLFNVRKFGRELQPKDFAYQVSVTEAAMFGTARTSYQKFGPTKLIVRHTAPIREGIIGARGRNILSMFVETAEGERFKFPANHLSGGRAFAQHINQGGKPHDNVGTQIAQLALESLQLAATSRYIHHCRNVLGEAATAIRPTIKNRVTEIRKSFTGLARPRGYHRVTEAGLPVMTTNLLEGIDGEVSRLAGILQIDANHSLAEALKPVALLTLGENMTNTNNLFNGVIALEDAAADNLLEALADEYGHDVSALTRNPGFVSFSEEAVYEDARAFLDAIQEAYMVNEENAIIAAARKWYQARFDSSDYEQTPGKVDADIQKGEQELIDGITAIVQGDYTMPNFPMRAPNFGASADKTSKARFYLDLFVTQHSLKNAATLNFVSGIIDKMAEGKKLEPIETFVANTLINALEQDLNGGEVDEGVVDESMTDWDLANGDRTDKAFLLPYVLEELTPEDVLNSGGHEHVVLGDDPAEFDAVSRKDLVNSARYVMYHQLEGMDCSDLPHTDTFLQHDAEKFVDQYVVPYVSQKGFELTEGDLTEFAQYEEKPEHHGIAAGDHVASDFGPGVVISIEGDLAAVEFMHGGAKTLHVDDLDKVPALGGVAEENELAEWFAGFDPQSVLSQAPVVEAPVDEAANKALTFKAWISLHGEDDCEVEVEYYIDDNEPVIDCITLAGSGEDISYDNLTGPDRDYIYNSALEDIAERDAVEQSYRDDARRDDAMMDKYYGDDRYDESEELDELSPARLNNYFDRGATSRGRLERKADDGDTEAARKLAKREQGLSRAFKKMRETEETDHNAADSRRPQGCTCSNHQLYQVGCDCGAEEVLGGDQGQDLINDTKVTEAPEDVFRGYSNEMLQTKLNLAQNTPGHEEYAAHVRKELERRGVTEDQMFREELEKLIKNAMFRR